MKQLFSIPIGILCVCLSFRAAKAQLAVYPISPEQAGFYILPPTCQIINSWYTGSPTAIARFDGFYSDIGIYDGVILTTGYTQSNLNGPLGPNNNASAGADIGYNSVPSPLGSWLYNEFALSQFFNVAIVSAQFKALEASFGMKYVFGSEEYNEYVGTQFGDGFALFIEGPGIPNGHVNIAKTPADNRSITINAINAGYSSGCTSGNYGTNEYLFVDNCHGEKVQYDGYTVPLLASIQLIPDSVYTMHAVIFDAGDGSYDSGVFLGKGGVTAAIHENAETKQALFPNPNNGNFTLHGVFGESSLKLLSVSGKIVFEKNMLAEGTINVTLDKLVPGIYVLHVFSGGLVNTHKLIIE